MIYHGTQSSYHDETTFSPHYTCYSPKGVFTQHWAERHSDYQRCDPKGRRRTPTDRQGYWRWIPLLSGLSSYDVSPAPICVTQLASICPVDHLLNNTVP